MQHFGIAFWCGGQQSPILSPCNTYELNFNGFSQDLWRYWYTYNDCYGLPSSVDIGDGIDGNPPRTVRICSNTTPVQHTDQPIGTPPMSATLIGACGEDPDEPPAPGVDCSAQGIFTGAFEENEVPWPVIQKVNLGAGDGTVHCNTIYDNAIKKVVIYDPNGNVLINFGWQTATNTPGDPQQDVTNFLASKGLPSEGVLFSSFGNTRYFDFYKNSSIPYVYVYSYLVWNSTSSVGYTGSYVKVRCPGQPPTP